MTGKVRCTKTFCCITLVISVNLVVFLVYLTETSHSGFMHPRFVIASSKRLLYSLTRLTSHAESETAQNVTEGIPVLSATLVPATVTEHSFNDPEATKRTSSAAIPTTMRSELKISWVTSRRRNRANLRGSTARNGERANTRRRFLKGKRLRARTTKPTKSTVSFSTVFPTMSYGAKVADFSEYNTTSEKRNAKHEPKLISPGAYDNEGAGYFKRAMTPAQTHAYIDLLEVFHNFTVKEKLIYMLYAGSLLGSYRFHGFIPWDDDIDIVMPYQEREKLESLTMPKGYELVTRQGVRWKFCRSEGPSIRNLPWRWPFVDISFYKETGDILWDIDANFVNSFKFNKNLVFPLIKRPFETRWFYAPYRTGDFLSQSYDIEDCATNSYNHREEYVISGANRHTAKCDTLRPYYAMVKRTKLPNGKIKESLIINSTVIQVLFFDKT